MKTYITIGSVLLNVVLGVALIASTLGTAGRYGATPGTEPTETFSFLSQPIFGGNSCLATSTTGTVGTLPNLADSVNCVDFTVNGADVTLTLMASTSAWLPKKVNASRTLRIRNASTTATADITLAAGTGINLKTASSSATRYTLFGDAGADNYSTITFTRQSDGDVNAEVISFTD